MLFSAPGLAQQPAAASPRDPARQDARAGSAIVRGRVLAADTGRPLRRARITVVSPELGREPRITSTGLDGRYEITDLPAGRYTIPSRARRLSDLAVRADAPARARMPLMCATARRSSASTSRSPRGCHHGTRRRRARRSDFGGAGLRDAHRLLAGTPPFVPSGMVARTDDAGEYRVSGLMPGTYLVMAVLRDTWTVRQGNIDQTFGYAPSYAPGARPSPRRPSV